MTFTASVCVCSFVKICRHLGFMCEMQPLVWTHSLQPCCFNGDQQISTRHKAQCFVHSLQAISLPAATYGGGMHFLFAAISLHRGLETKIQTRQHEHDE